MRIRRMAAISKALSRNFDDIISDLYLKDKLTAVEISGYLLKKSGISITTRSIQRRLRALNIIRSYSEAFNLAIQKGRKSYAHLRKPVKSRELRKGINLKTRYLVLQRDAFKCVLCGQDGKNDILVIDHIKPIVKGGTNDINNLQTLCRACNQGKMLLDEKHVK